MKTRLFWVTLSFIGVSWVLNSLYAYSKQLDAPIFLEHYIETVAQENNHLTFYYLTNKNDVSSISHVKIGDIMGYVEMNNFSYNFFDDFDSKINQDVQTFTHHALRRIDVKFHDFENIMKDGLFSFKKMEVFFSDGSSMTVPIGEVIVYSTYRDTHFLEQRISSISNNDRSEFTYKVKEELAIQDITTNFEEILKDHLIVKIHSTNKDFTKEFANESFGDSLHTDWETLPGTDIVDVEFPYKLEENDAFILNAQISPKFIGVLQAFVILSGITESGKEFTNYTGLNNPPYFEEKDINQFIKEKSKGEVQ